MEMFDFYFKSNLNHSVGKFSKEWTLENRNESNCQLICKNKKFLLVEIGCRNVERMHYFNCNMVFNLKISSEMSKLSLKLSLSENQHFSESKIIALE